MDIAAMGVGSVVTATLGLKQANTAEQAGMALLKKDLDSQKELASQLLQAMGIGRNVDVQA
jgi:hypothetical protein